MPPLDVLPLSGLTITACIRVDPRIAGTGRPLLLQTDMSQRRRGRPPLSLRVRRDQIAGHVLHLQSIEPNRQVESIIAEVMQFHGVSRATVHTARREHDPDKPIVGFGTIAVTAKFQTTKIPNYLDSDSLDTE
jgi:hypothetical protein